MISDVNKQHRKKVQTEAIECLSISEWLFRMKWWCILDAKCYVDDQHQYNIRNLARMERNES